MRRGFKAWCERTAGHYRAAINSPLDQALDPKVLADHVGTQVWRPEDVPDLPHSSYQQLTGDGKDDWSAVTITVGRINLTIVNSAHSLNRQRSSITHELAHLILDHEPGRIDISPAGHLLLNSFDKDQEAEADWLSGALLVPREGLHRAYRVQQNNEELAARFGVSADMLHWRLRMTGVAAQVRRASRYR